MIASLRHLTEYLVFRQILPNLLSQYIMRRSQLHHFSTIPDKAMSITGSHIELIYLVCQLPLYLPKQHGTVFRAYLGSTVIYHPFFFKRVLFLGKRHDVTANGDICLLHGHANTQRFQRRASGVIFFGIVPQHGKIRNIRTRLHPLGNRMHHPQFTESAESVQIRRLCPGKRRLILQRGNRFIRHTIAQHHNIFH